MLARENNTTATCSGCELKALCSPLSPLWAILCLSCSFNLFVKADMSAIGPELPPHLLNRTKNNISSEAEDEASVVGPQIPPHLVAGPSKCPSQPPPQAENEANEEDSDSDDDYGPALPPDLLAARSSALSTTTIGPSLPQAYNESQNHDRRRYGDDADEDDSDDDVGPMPLPAGISFEEEDGVREFMEREERRRKQIEVHFNIRVV